MEEIMLQTQWGWPIALYLFLGGLGAGTLLVSALIDFRFKALKRTVSAGAWAGVVCLGVGTLLLLVDVTMPTRALMLWQSFSNLGSWMAIGAWLLACGMVVGAVYALVCTLGKAAGLRKGLSVVAMVFGVCIAAYTGILLSVLVAHPLWNTMLLPVLFLVSAVDTGIALTAILASTIEKKDEPALENVKALLEKGTLVLVALEVVVLVVMLVLVASGSETGALSVSILVSGKLALPFWVLFVVVGLVVPAFVAFKAVSTAKKDAAAAVSKKKETPESASTVEASAAPRKSGLSVVGALCCLVGGCALRFLILMAGIPVWM